MRGKVFLALTLVTAFIAGQKISQVGQVPPLDEVVEDILIPEAKAALVATNQLQSQSQVKFEPVISDSAINTQYSVKFQERECLREAMYFEARGESLAGRLAVGLVVMNRVNRPDFPNSICGVVHEGPVSRKGIPLRNKCQFSYFCDGKPDTAKDQQAWLQALQDAQVILDGRVYDFTGGATHYHANYVSTNWGYPKVAQIDNHVFYKRK